MAHVVLLYHIIWRTKKSEKTINPIFERELYAYINGFCTEKQCRLFRIGGMEDHIHLLVSIRPDISISEFMQVLKSQTSHFHQNTHSLKVGEVAMPHSATAIEIKRSYGNTL